MTTTTARAAAGDEPAAVFSVVDEQAHGWWLLANRPVHNRRCAGCRRSPGGPDHVPEPRRIR